MKEVRREEGKEVRMSWGKDGRGKEIRGKERRKERGKEIRSGGGK